jgi:hypothetical protein
MPKIIFEILTYDYGFLKNGSRKMICEIVKGFSKFYEMSFTQKDVGAWYYR